MLGASKWAWGACLMVALLVPGVAAAQTFLDTLFEDEAVEPAPWEGPPPQAWRQDAVEPPSSSATTQAPSQKPAGVFAGAVAFPDGSPAVGPAVSLANASVFSPLWQNRPLGDFLVERSAVDAPQVIGGVGVGYWERSSDGWRGPDVGLEGPIPYEVADNMMSGWSHNSFVATPDLAWPFLAVERNGRMWRATVGTFGNGPLPPSSQAGTSPSDGVALMLPDQEGGLTLLGPGTDWVGLWRSPDGVVRALLLEAEGDRMAAIDVDPVSGTWVGEPRDVELLPGIWDGSGAPDAAPKASEENPDHWTFDAVLRRFGWAMYPVWSNSTHVVWEVPTILFDGQGSFSPPSRFWLLDLQEGFVVELDAKAWGAAYVQGRPDPASILYRP